jgi:iron complex outermembrane recepter protein
MKTLLLSTTLLLGSLVISFAQEELPQEEDYYELSLEELMNVPINSASKKDETLFDAPLSSHTITKSEIEKSGATSIMEALRLAPGVIVREQTNGVYDIHIRGFDNIIRTGYQPYVKSNLTTLVMIDNRPVFNNNLGGTFWETLPIDINDVERIEIVRGPSAPLFGPNAVTGVINIITKRTANNTWVDVNLQAGTIGTQVLNATMGTKATEKLSVGASFNYQNRERFDDTYFSVNSGEYVSKDQLGIQADKRFPNESQALNKYGVNTFITYKPKEKVSFDLSAGLQKNEVQKVFLGVTGVTNLTSNESDSRYLNLSANIKGLSLRTSYINGFDNINVGANPSKYDYNNYDINTEYTIKWGNAVFITPGVSYQSAVYSDKDYITANNGFLNGEKNITTLAGYVRSDMNITEKLRVLAAVRADKFSKPDKTRVSYELASTYKFNERNLIRAAITQSNSGSFIGNNYLDVQNIPPSEGNEDLELFTVQMIELGYRSKLSKSLQFDIDVFRQVATDFSALVINGFIALGVPTFQFQNLPTETTQLGATFSLNYVPSEKIQFKPFLTFQKTEVTDLPTQLLASALNPTLRDDDHKNTPSVYGGYYLNWKAAEKININLNGYYLGEQTQYDYLYESNEGVGDESKIDSKFIFSIKASFNITPSLCIYVNARNALASSSREFFAGDETSALYLGGLSFSLK